MDKGPNPLWSTITGHCPNQNLKFIFFFYYIPTQLLIYVYPIPIIYE